MALSKTVSTNSGLLVPNAYIRIDEQSGGKNVIDLRVRIYVSKEKREEGAAWVEEKLQSFVPDTSENSSNFIKQGYDFLKTLEEYADSIAC